MDCPALLPPAHGYFVRNECKNVFNAACGVRCHGGYQVGFGVSLTYIKPFTSFLVLASDCAYLLGDGVERPRSARLKLVGQCNLRLMAMSPAQHTTMKWTLPASLGRQTSYPGLCKVERDNIMLGIGIDPVIPLCHFLRKEKATLFTHPNGLIGENPCSNANQLLSSSSPS